MSSILNPLSIDAEVADRLQTDADFRNAFIRLWSQTQVASEIRRLRQKRKLRQSEVASLTGTGQSAISRIEKAEYDGWTFKTLLAIAIELKAQLQIRFVEIETIAREQRNSNTGTDSDDVEVIGDDPTAKKLWELEDGIGTADCLHVRPGGKTVERYQMEVI